MTPSDKHSGLPNLNDPVAVNLNITMDALDKKKQCAVERGAFLQDFAAILGTAALGGLQAGPVGAGLAMLFGVIGLFAKYSGLGGLLCKSDGVKQHRNALRPALATVRA
jgi:hypothetical protein